MATKLVPTADLIRAQLRRMRNAAGMSQEDYGKRAHYSASMVSAVETGQRPLDEVYLARADEIFETDGLFVPMLELAKRDGEPTWFRPWLEAERNATQLRCFEPTLIPGLLQTEDYARAVIRTDARLTEDEVEKLVAARLERQAILNQEHPPQLIAVMDAVGTAAVRRGMRQGDGRAASAPAGLRRTPERQRARHPDQRRPARRAGRPVRPGPVGGRRLGRAPGQPARRDRGATAPRRWIPCWPSGRVCVTTRCHAGSRWT